MKKKLVLIALGMCLVGPQNIFSQTGLIPRFELEPCEIGLERPAQPNTYFDKVGRKFAILGYESGTFEAWAYPLKLVRNFELSFLIGSSTRPISAKEIVRYVSATPAATTLTYTFQSFTVKAIFITSIEEPGAIILLAVDTTEPLTIICSFLPVLQPMWPAGIGGQYAYWDNDLKAYLISEPTRKNHGYIGSPAAQGISYTPAHMLSDSPNEFKIVVENKDAVKGRYIPIILAGGKGKREEIRKTYESLAANPEARYRAAVGHYQKLQQDTLRVRTPDKKMNLAFEWAKVAFDNLMVDNPDLGKGLIAGLGTSGTGGRPGFGWFFGGDAFMNSLSLTSYGAFSMVKEALAFTQKWQRQDGKMAHELSQAAGYLDWFKDYPYGYIHGDTTPFYIAACYEYFRMSGDAAFLKQSWPSLQRAFDWCLTTDGDGDGLMDNRKAGLGALEFGSLTGIQTDIYLAAAWVRAAYAMQQIAQVAGDAKYAKLAAAHLEKAGHSFRSKFWDAEKGRYTYAFNADGKQVQELTPWSAVPLVWNIGEAEQSVRTLENFNSAELTTDWGIRMLSNKSGYFEPLNYNYGAVWPFLTGWVATALFQHNFSLQGYGLLMAAVRHTFDNGLGYVTELFSGHQNIWPQEAVCHQGFSSSGVVFPFVRGLLGLDGDAPKKQIVFMPRFPADWKEVAIDQYKIGEESFSLHFRRQETSLSVNIISKKNSAYRMIFGPALGLGTDVRGARLNGKSVRPRVEKSPLAQAVQPSVEFNLTGRDTVEIDFEPTVELLPPSNESKTGESNKGLRIIKMERTGKALKVTMEGLADQAYVLAVTQSKRIESVSGAQRSDQQLLIQFPKAPAGEFVRQEIIINLR
jgi:glycogen debranching enzyme